jgi:hypothetical protein
MVTYMIWSRCRRYCREELVEDAKLVRNRSLDGYLAGAEHLDGIAVRSVLVGVRIGLRRIRKGRDVDTGRLGASGTPCRGAHRRVACVEWRPPRHPFAVVGDVAVRVPATAVYILSLAKRLAHGGGGEVTQVDILRIRPARATRDKGATLHWRAVVNWGSFACQRKLLVVE